MNLDEATSLNGAVPISQHASVVRKGQILRQRVQAEPTHFTHLATIRAWFASLNLARVHDQNDRVVPLRVRADQGREANGDPELLADLAHGGLLEHFASVDVARREAPQAAPRIDAAPPQQHLVVVGENDGYGDLRVEIVDEAARRTRWPVAVLLQARFERRATQQTVAVGTHANSASGSSSSNRA